MGCKLSTFSSQTVSAATAGGVLTITDTSVLSAGQTGNIRVAGATPVPRTIKVTAILTSTTFRANFNPKVDDDNFDRASDSGYPTNFNGSDLSGYSGGTVSFEPQIVDVPRTS